MNTLAGYIKLHRKMKNWRWKDHPPTLCLFIHLLLSASYETEYTGSGIVLTPGQVVISRKNLVKETGLTEMQVRTALSHLQQTNEIVLDTSQGCRTTIATIQNWALYQDMSKSQPSSGSKKPLSNQENPHHNNLDDNQVEKSVDYQPSSQPSFQPSEQPSFQPSQQPSSGSKKPMSNQENQLDFKNNQPSQQPSEQPSFQPSEQPFFYYKKNIKKYKNNKEDINNHHHTRARAEDTDFGPVQIDPLIIKVQQELNGLTDTHYMELDSFRDELPDELVSYAIDSAVENGVRSWSYVRSILERYVREQIRTIGEAKARDEKRKQQQKATFPQRPQKVVSAQQYTQREYDEKKLEEQLGVNDLFRADKP